MEPGGGAVRVRPWAPTDTEATRHILLETWRATYGPFVPDADLTAFLDSAYAADRMAGLHCDDPPRALRRAFIADVGGVAVGYLRLSRAEGPVCDIHSLYVLPQFQKKGVGRALLNEAVCFARGLRCEALRLSVMSANRAAIEWYRREGFTVDTAATADFWIGRTRIDVVAATRALS